MPSLPVLLQGLRRLRISGIMSRGSHLQLATKPICPTISPTQLSATSLSHLRRDFFSFITSASAGTARGKILDPYHLFHQAFSRRNVVILFRPSQQQGPFSIDYDSCELSTFQTPVLSLCALSHNSATRPSVLGVGTLTFPSSIEFVISSPTRDLLASGKFWKMSPFRVITHPPHA